MPITRVKSSTRLKKVGNRIEMMLQMIEDLLAMSRVKSNSLLGSVEVLDLREAISEIIPRYGELAQARGLSLTHRFPDTPVSVRIDNKALQLIISNLLSNAVKYTNQGSVSVTVRVQEKNAIVEFADTGIGIPEKDRASLCREFFRASNARNQKISGTGVGLSGVKNLVERFSGRLDFASEEKKVRLSF